MASARWITLPALAAAALALALVAAAACGGGDDSKASSPAPAVDEAPLKAVREGLDALNRGEIDTAFTYLSQEARKEISLDTAKAVLNGLRTAGLPLSVSIDRVGE